MDEVDELDRCQSYSELVGLNKPIGLTEFGPLTEREGEFDCDRVMEAYEKYPELRFVLFWHSWPENRMAIVDQQHRIEFMSHPDAITRQEVEQAMQGTTSHPVP